MTPNLTPARDGGQVPSPPTERVVVVMQLFAAEPERVFSLAEVARLSGISRATGHAILATLVRHDWVLRNGTEYSVGPAFGGAGRIRPVLRDLSESLGVQVFLARRDGSSIVVTESVGETAAPTIGPGLRIPLIAPFGRDYIAWAGERHIATWLGDSSPQLCDRLAAVLGAVRDRGYVVERLSREYTRVYTALHALAADGEPDPIAARLAGAFADLTLVDVLPDECTGTLQIATVSAPIRNADGDVVMSLTAAPLRKLRAREVADIGAAVCTAAEAVDPT